MERPRSRTQFSLQAMFVLMTLLAAFCYWLTLPSVVVSQIAELWQATDPPTLNMLVPEIEDGGTFQPMPPSSRTIDHQMLLREKYLIDLHQPGVEIPPSAPHSVPARPPIILRP